MRGGIPPVLSSGSPCIGAGDVSYSSNIGYDTSFTCPNSMPFSVFSIQKNDVIDIYPNPASEKIIVQAHRSDKQVLEIADCGGNVVTILNFFGAVEIDLHNVPAGIYSATVRNDHHFTTKKLVVLH